MSKVILNIGTVENELTEKIVLTEKDQKSLFEFFVKLLQTKKKLTGSVNSDQKLIVHVDHGRTPMIMIDSIELAMPYPREKTLKKLLKE